MATATVGAATTVEGATVRLPHGLPPGAVLDTGMTTLPNAVLNMPSPDAQVRYDDCLHNAQCAQWTYVPPNTSGPPLCVMHYGAAGPVMAAEGLITGSIYRVKPNVSILKKAL